jgi:phosphoglycerate dehydrogenase-like enzyme
VHSGGFSLSIMHARPTIALAMRPELTGDFFGADQWNRIEEFADVADRKPIVDFSNATDALSRADILLTGWGCPAIDAAALVRAPRLKLIAHTGSTVKPIVTDAVWSRGILVTSAAAANAVPVAEYALAAILLANKRVFVARESYRRERRPERSPWAAPGEPGNLGAVIGIVGASRTARRLLALLRNFELKTLVYDPIAPEADIRALGAEPATLPALFAQSDVVSVHAPSLPQTNGMIDAALLARMRNGATIINTARGEVIDQDALERELLSGRISAVLDVTTPEPLAASSKLFDLPNVFLTPHVAGAAGFETRRMTDLAIEEIRRYAQGQSLLHGVTRNMLASIG